MTRRAFLTCAVLPLLLAARLAGQRTPALDSLLTTHRSAMQHLDGLHGEWRGPAWTLLPSGERAEFVQTVRVGVIGEGAYTLVEGRSYDMEGLLSGTNLDIISFNASTGVYTLRLYTQGTTADVPIVPTGKGFTLEYPSGDATVRFTISVADGIWHETAEQWRTGQDPVRFLELRLERVGSTGWPAAGAMLFR